MNTLAEKTMTIREVAEVLNKDESTVRKIGKELFPEIFQNGKITYLNESHVTAIKLNLGKNSELPKTRLEKALLIKQAIAFQDEIISELTTENQSLKSTVNLLVHDNNKRYTTTELAKELHLTSAQVLNTTLKNMGIQYLHNKTWVLTSKYSDKNYVETKQEEKNGIVIYHRLWTGEGRLFLLSLFSKTPDPIRD